MTNHVTDDFTVDLRHAAWQEYMDLRSRLRRVTDDGDRSKLVARALEIARVHDFEILLPMGPDGELTPEAAQQIWESLGQYLQQQRNGCDQREIVRLRLAAEAKIRQLLKGFNRNVRGIDKTEGGDV